MALPRVGSGNNRIGGTCIWVLLNRLLRVQAQEEPLNRFMSLLEDEIKAEKEKPANRKIPRWLELLEELSSMTLDAKKSRSVLRLQYLKDTVMRAVGITVANARYEGNKYLNEMREALEAVAELNER